MCFICNTWNTLNTGQQTVIDTAEHSRDLLTVVCYETINMSINADVISSKMI